ncbi:MAG TPA: 50S ribosomal protein L11 methyltransferase [Terriglobia bacterium]|jgi:ribosomal protein L11 methylase PrmA
MPYRIDIPIPPDDALDRLIQLGALDIEAVHGGIAAILPDRVRPGDVAGALGLAGVAVSRAVARDNGSVWLLSPRAVRIAGIVIAPQEGPAPLFTAARYRACAPPGALRLTDSTAFGTGHHPTTALCIEAIEEALAIDVSESVLDVGTGSGVLALAALMMGVPRATGIDIDADALRIAAKHARLNHLADRLHLLPGGPDAVEGTWPLVVANVLAAPLVEIAPILVRRVGGRGRLILSGIPESLESEVRFAYLRLGMRHIRSGTRSGWTVLVFQASW